MILRFCVFRLTDAPVGLTQAGQIALDGLLKAEIQGVADESVADRHLVEPRKRLAEEFEILQIEVVTGVDAKSEVVGCARSLDERSYRSLAVGLISIRIRFGIQFDAVGASSSCGPDDCRIRSYENRRAYAVLLERVDNRSEKFTVGFYIPSGRRSERIGCIGDQRHLLGPRAEYQFHEFRRRIALDIEFYLDQRPQGKDIGAADVALVGARMHRDALCAEILTVDGHFFDRRLVLPAGVAQGCYLVDIDTEACHWLFIIHCLNFSVEWMEFEKNFVILYQVPTTKLVEINLMTKENQLKAAKKESMEVFFPPNADSSRLLIGCSYDDYIASRIARAVEDVDARLLNLNVTSLEVEGQQVVAALRVDHRNPDSVVRSLERYGYTVINSDSPAPDDDTLRDRYEQLMKYLSL